jgi:hypothetical protein
MFPTKNALNPGDALTPLLFNFSLDNAIRWVQVNPEGLQLNGKLQVLVYADVILGRTLPTAKTNRTSFSSC